jgi:hypothetical protein
MQALFNRKEPAMSIFASPRFLRSVLWADAASGAATALLQLTAANALAALLGLSSGLLVASGLALVVYVAGAAYLASCNPVPRGPVWALIIGNWAWVAGCVALLMTGAAGTAPGQAYLAVQAIAVAVLAELQWMSLRRTPVAGWA